jgi:glycosyltransferase involved in cell wall biosynthesis
MDVEFSAVVPCYNEEGNVAAIAAGFAEKAPAGCELVLVNNGSSDGTAAAVAAAQKQYPFVRAVHVSVNQGYGHGINQGLAAAQGEWLGWTHGDMQCDPADLFRALELAKKSGANAFVKGLRSGRGMTDRFFTAGMSVFESLYFWTRLWDINAQPAVFHRSFYARWQEPPGDFTLDLYACALARKLDMKILRMPVKLSPRHDGVSSWNRGLASRLALSAGVIKASMRIKKVLP